MNNVSLQNEIRDCHLCSLRQNCDQVLLTQSGNSGLMIVKARPTIDEAVVGEHFFGREGQYLKKLLIDASIEPTSVIVTCLNKCPGNAKKVEITTCGRWLDKEIQEIRPKFILTLGKTPTAYLLKLKNKDPLKDFINNFYRVYRDNVEFDVIPWYDMSTVMNRSFWTTTQTINLLQKIKRLM